MSGAPRQRCIEAQVVCSPRGLEHQNTPLALPLELMSELLLAMTSVRLKVPPSDWTSVLLLEPVSALPLEQLARARGRLLGLP
jgi:hypothetical protein